ncbi:hypothetical protein EW145_g4491 [Phellinidium pouzarii]|uniref:DNA binding protein Ncp1 n=1 Tax=Phellinidium pouzarii TaxID=167371 RepID=A0A4S4L3B5_9AGAM|nr:hypothetical protein EW145_g4491 [Phellinidium pouzarii]
MSVPTPTPASEKSSVYFDANSASREHLAHANGSADTVTPAATEAAATGAGADVVRKPSVATGAIERHRNGILTNKDEKPPLRANSSGYVSDANTDAERPTKGQDAHASVGTAINHDHQSPPYTEANQLNAPYASDAKTQPATGGTQTSQGDINGSTSADTRGKSPSQSISKTGNRRARGAFGLGAATTSPEAVPEDNAMQHQRFETAESGISEEANAKIDKSEMKDAKRLSKVIKAEAKAQNKSLDTALKELEHLQKIQKKASKEESRSLSAHIKAVDGAHKLHTKFFSMKAKYERGQADLSASEEQLESSRAHARDQTEALATKTRELEELRRAKAVDDRERETREGELRRLSQNGKK